jgi:hypothetical protein
MYQYSTASGDVAAEPSNGFPNFADGDVQIISSTGRTWELHSATMRHSSKGFRDLIDGQEARRPHKRRKDEVKSVRWKIFMVPWEGDVYEGRLRSFRIVVSSNPLPSLL